MENTKQKRNQKVKADLLRQSEDDDKPNIVLNKDFFEEDENKESFNDADELTKMFDNENSESSILKELFNAKDFKTRTELSGDEISLISRLYIQSRITKRPLLSKVLDEFLVLRISKDRKSRKEFVDGYKNAEKENSGFLNKMFGR